MRAREPDGSGYVENAGARIYYEVFGSGPKTLLFLPTWSLVHSRVWKLQVPYFARHYRVIAFDGRGNGKSSRPSGAEAYSAQNFVDDALAVMDATVTARATVAGYSMGGLHLAMLAANHASRVAGAVFIGPVAPFGAKGRPERTAFSWSEPLPTSEGWAKHNKHYWKRAYDDWLAFFAGKVLTEPHSTKGIEDVIGWGNETNADVLIATYEAPESPGEPPSDLAQAAQYYARIACPVLVIHGSDDEVIAHSAGAGVAKATGGTLVTIAGGGHAPHLRHPVKVNILLRRFMDDVAATADRAARSWRTSQSTPRGLRAEHTHTLR
ncbi:MAG TPA: alpha/beta hydrolase [Candidatus Eremiobacteraceae bacterium]|nr:alpha/beta hydrolase [Candidatus Eremiobacteraceae bacterium]